VIPTNPAKVVVVDREALRAALQRTAILSNEKYRGVRMSLLKNVVKLQAHNPEQEEAQDEVEIDYALAPLFWGRGIATEAVRACLRFGFETARLAQVIGLVVPENTPSRRVLEKVGFAYQRDAPYFGHMLALYTLPSERFLAADEG